MGAGASAVAAAAGGSACVGWTLPWGPSAAAANQLIAGSPSPGPPPLGGGGLKRQGECAVGRSAQEEGGSASEIAVSFLCSPVYSLA